MASTGRTATTKAMGKGSTQFQHLVQTEIPRKLLEHWLEIWREHHGVSESLSVQLRPHTAGSDLLELNVLDQTQSKMANLVFTIIQDRRGKNILSIRDENTFKKEFRQKRLITLMHLFLIHRYKASSAHYVSPTADNQKQTEGMKAMGVYKEVNTEIGDIIVAEVNESQVKKLVSPDRVVLKKLILKKG